MYRSCPYAIHSFYFNHIKMNVIKTAIDGVVIIEPRLFKDARGYLIK